MMQLALYATEMVDRLQVLLPCTTDTKGRTLYDKMLSGELLSRPGPEDD
jgi:hypothetical protein